MTQVTFDLVEFQQPIEDYIDHAQASLKTQEERHAKHGIMAVGKALALVDLVIPRVTGNDLQKFAEYRRVSQALIIAFWQDFGLVYLKRANEPEAAVVRKVVHIASDNGHVKENLPMKNGTHRKRGRHASHEKKMRIGELANNVPDGVGVEKWFHAIVEDKANGINNIGSVYAYRQYYREQTKEGGR